MWQARQASILAEAERQRHGWNGRLPLETRMKPVLLTASIVTIIATAACGGREESAASDAPSSNGAASAPVTVENAYDVRHERFEGMGDSLKAINRELKGDAPDVARIRQEAASLVSAGERLPSWFPAGSGPDVHTRSRAKAEIWSDGAGFRRVHANFLQQAQAFERLAEAGNVEQMRGTSGALGKSCGNCHDSYRGPEK
jgi:cytochrome c556